MIQTTLDFKRFNTNLNLPEVKSALRVRTLGEVYTPTQFVSLMLNEIEENTWANPNYIYIEPTCGCGAFVLEVFDRKYRALLKKRTSVDRKMEAAVLSLNSIIGLDIVEDNIDDTRANLLRRVITTIGIPDTPSNKELRFLACAAAIITANLTVNDALKADFRETIQKHRFSALSLSQQNAEITELFDQLEKALRKREHVRFDPGFLNLVINPPS